MFCAYPRPRYKVSVYRTIGPLVSKLLSKCSVKLHPNKRTLKFKDAFGEQLLWLYLLSEVMLDVIVVNNE